MKALILSDSHSHFNLILEMYNLEKPDVVIFAGDNCKDAHELSFANEKIPFYIVKGNCDFFDYNTEDIMEFELENKKFLLTHGHLYGVKRSYRSIEMEASIKGVNIVIFGHTHIPYYKKIENIEFFNPGAAQDGNYGVLEIIDGEISFENKIY